MPRMAKVAGSGTADALTTPTPCAMVLMTVLAKTSFPDVAMKSLAESAFSLVSVNVSVFFPFTGAKIIAIVALIVDMARIRSPQR
jgi:hypothetical protein